MVQYCVAYGCKEMFKKGTSISFHSFPADESLKMKWILALKRVNFKPSKHSRLCSNHFTADCFDLKAFGLGRKLKMGAVPSIFEFPQNLQKRGNERKLATTDEGKVISSYLCELDMSMNNICRPPVRRTYKNVFQKKSVKKEPCLDSDSHPEYLVVMPDIKKEDCTTSDIEIATESEDETMTSVKEEPYLDSDSRPEYLVVMPDIKKEDCTMSDIQIATESEDGLVKTFKEEPYSSETSPGPSYNSVFIVEKHDSVGDADCPALQCESDTGTPAIGTDVVIKKEEPEFFEHDQEEDPLMLCHETENDMNNAECGGEEFFKEGDCAALAVPVLGVSTMPRGTSGKPKGRRPKRRRYNFNSSEIEELTANADKTDSMLTNNN